MRILYLCPDLGIPVLGSKGAAIHVRGLTSALARGGHEVLVVAPRLTKSPWETPAPFPVPVRHVPPEPAADEAFDGLRVGVQRLLDEPGSLPGEVRRILYNALMIDKLPRIFGAQPPDMIYERASLHWTAGLDLARAIDRPLLVEINAPLVTEQSRYRGAALPELAARAEALTLAGADAVLAVSTPLAEHAIALGAAKDRVHVIPNAVDPALFHPGPVNQELRSRHGIDGGPVIGFVGGLRPWHGVRILAPLLERLTDRHPDLRLIVAGDGPLRHELGADLESRGLARKAILTGPIAHEELPGLIRGFDVALAPYSPSDHDFYFSPLKLFEYMACGVPTVATGVGQIGEVIHHGETGLLYPADDLDELSTACESLLSDPSLRQRLGRAAADYVLSHHTWEKNAERVVDLAESAMAHGGRA